jgi:hypothetical protein
MKIEIDIDKIDTNEVAVDGVSKPAGEYHAQFWIDDELQFGCYGSIDETMEMLSERIREELEFLEL